MSTNATLLPKDIIGRSSEPVFLGGLVRSWPAVRKWKQEFLQALAQDRMVSVVCGNREQHKPEFRSMKLADFFEQCLSPTNTNGPRLYLKEFELLEELPELMEDVDLRCFRFPYSRCYHDAWIGQKGARTGLHCDIFHNFLTHITGTKEIVLIPPEFTKDVYPSNKFDYCARLSKVNGFDPDAERFPGFARALEASRKFVLEPGDVVYIPKGWWHQVVSLTPTISLSGFVIRWADKPGYLMERLRKRAHNLGVYKKGHCTCHA